MEESEGISKQGLVSSSESEIGGLGRKSEGMNFLKSDCNVSNQLEIMQTDEIVIVGEETKYQNVIPLSAEKKRKLCKDLNVPYCDIACEQSSSSVNAMDKPKKCKRIQQDGTCFFRAISFSITNSESHHQCFREIVCQHILKNEMKSQPYMRSEESLKNYMSSSRMMKDGTWATELEIFATSDLLEVDIFTYSNLRWLQFSLNGLHPDVVNQNEAIYLNHKQQNHYDVVLKVTAKRANLNFFHNSNNDHKSKYNLRKQNRLRMKTKIEYTGLKVPVDSIRNRKSELNEKYNNNTYFRRRMLEQKKNMYLNAYFKSRTQMKNRNRYHENVEYQSNQIQKGTQKYALDCEYRNQVLNRSKNKYYLLDLEYRKGKKDSVVRKYMIDDQHRGM